MKPPNAVSAAIADALYEYMPQQEDAPRLLKVLRKLVRRVRAIKRERAE